MFQWRPSVFLRRGLAGLLRLAGAAIFIAQPALAAAPPPDSPPLEPIYDEISPADELAMRQEIERNLAWLRQAGRLPDPVSAQAVTYDFPLRLAPGRPDYAGFTVSAFADHNPGAGQVLDYNGGARTYDGHRGTDYALWPFGWNKLEAGDAQVVAAAAGTIINKVDGDATDRNPCDGGSNSDLWNYIVLLHADNRITIYGHLRYRSLTSKGVGQTVAQGEYLGTAASSGNSSGPHLHFEVRTGAFSNTEWMDPYAGPASQPESLWTSQRLYVDSAINLLATHAAPPTSIACQPSTTNLQDSFTAPANIYFYAYYRDYQGPLATQFNIYRPDGSVFQAWQDIPADNKFYNALSRARVFAVSAADPAGTWRFEAVYNGQAYQTFFNVNAPPVITVTSPNGGEQWDRLLPHSVTWTDNLGGEVNIDLYRNGVYSATLASNTPSDGEFLWTPDPAQLPGTGYTVRVTSVINPAVRDESDAPFTLQPVPAPSLSLAKAASVSAPQPGQTINYFLVMTNTGPGDASGGRLTEVLPAGLTPAGPIRLDPAGLGLAGALPNAVFSLTLAPGRSLTVTIPVLVNLGQPAGALITNTAFLTCTEIVTPLLASSVITLADAPLAARDDFFMTPLDTPVVMGVLDNDGDPNGDPIVLAALGKPMSGVVGLAGPRLVYTPTSGFLGADVFTYTVSAGAQSAQATVRVVVAAEIFGLFLPVIWR